MLLSQAVFVTALAESEDYVTEMIDNYLQIRQKPNTQQQLRQFFEAECNGSDTVYAIMYKPMSCPRCEAFIRDFCSMIKQNDKSAKVAMVSIYPDSAMAMNYNRRNKYAADYYINDTENQYKNIFSFNNTSPILYLLKVSIRNGRLIAGGNPAMLCDEFVAQIISRNEPMEFHDFGDANDSDNIEAVKPNAINIKNRFTDFSVSTDKDFPISSIYYYPKWQNDNFFFTDVLANGVMLFQAN